MWNKITDFLSFTGIEDKTVWQDILLSSFLIPLIIFLSIKVYYWWNRFKPSKAIFRDYLNENLSIYIFHSQMTSADDNYHPISNPKYVTRFPQPLPTDHTSLGKQNKFNIDPVCSEADSQCVADIFNILGLVQKTKNIYIGDLIKDWNRWSDPIFSVGFNPKTNKLIERGIKTHFNLVGSELIVKNTDLSFGCILPNDAGVIQKSFDLENKSPIFILAGLGTVGTSAAGYLLKNNFIKFGKLYGNRSFCVFFQAKIDEGKNSAVIKHITPKPKLIRSLMYPFVYLDFSRRGYFKTA